MTVDTDSAEGIAASLVSLSVTINSGRGVMAAQIADDPSKHRRAQAA
jgi:hypothetical protein